MFKKITIVAFLLISSFTFSQAIFEQSYFINQDEGGDITFSFNTETATYHYTYDNNNVLKIYTENHSLFATINLPVPSGYTLNNLQLFTDKLFNSDNLIEFMMLTRNGNTYKMSLVNQNGIIIQEFGDKSDALVIKTMSNNYKLITQKGSYVSGSSFTEKDVYSLSGTLSTKQNSILSKTSFLYPNPVKDVLNISNPLNINENSTLKIFSINGQLVLQKKISNEDGNFIKLDVANLQSGTYIYKIDETSNKFIKE